MAKISEFQETNIVKTAHECDVLVAGGGVAGISAALAAARSGARVILLERAFVLGGLATAGLVTIYLPLCDGMGHQVSFGIAEELFRLSIKHGYEDRYPTIWLDRDASVEERAAAPRRFEVQFNAHLFAIAAEQLLVSEGVKILYGTTVASVRRDGEKISHVVIESKSGRQAIEINKSVVDATGDADVCYLAGAKCELHGEGNVLASWYYSVSGGEYKLNQLGFCDVSDEEKRAGITVPMLTNRRFSGVDAEEISEMVEMSHASLLNNFLERKRTQPDILPVNVATIPQLRMTRKLVGDYVLDKSEVHTYQPSSIGLVSDWRKRGPVYEIPFGALYSNEVKNLAVAGRCISVTDAMWDVTRVIPVCAVTGEAAGLAAAITDDFTTLDVASLQNELRLRGVRIHESEI